MTKEQLIQVKLGGKTVQVPVFQDEKTTLQIVASVNARLRDIEESSTRVDTQAYALQAAYLFAVDSIRAGQAADEGDAELLKNLVRIQVALKGILGDLAKPS
ncbi:MAG: cell division protein ZapA [Candidatus Hydrogenedentes bacterium]|nr:cell division protein ZapA [Candidatus Hydrogenedentota bacterium]